jgi:hypothetical protein
VQDELLAGVEALLLCPHAGDAKGLLLVTGIQGRGKALDGADTEDDVEQLDDGG